MKDVPIFGDHHTYAGDNPWWTLRFKRSLSPKDKTHLTSIVTDHAFSQVDVGGIVLQPDPRDWEMKNRQVQMVTPGGIFVGMTTDKFQSFCSETDLLFEGINRDLPLLARIPQLGARTETEKAGIFTNKKAQVVAGSTDKLFCEEKMPEFSVESRDPTGESGLAVFLLRDAT